MKAVLETTSWDGIFRIRTHFTASGSEGALDIPDALYERYEAAEKEFHNIQHELWKISEGLDKPQLTVSQILRELA